MVKLVRVPVSSSASGSGRVWWHDIPNQELHCQENQESQESYNIFNGAHTSGSMRRAGTIVDDSKSGCRRTDLMAQTTSTIVAIFHGRAKVFNNYPISVEQ